MEEGFTSWHDPKAAEMNHQPQWALGIHTLRTATYALGIGSSASAAFGDVRWLDFLSRLSRWDLPQRVFREHIFSNIPVFCNVCAGHILRQLLLFSWPAQRVALDALLSQEGLVPLRDSLTQEGGSWEVVADQIQGPASSLSKDDQRHTPREEYEIRVWKYSKNVQDTSISHFSTGDYLSQRL